MDLVNQFAAKAELVDVTPISEGLEFNVYKATSQQGNHVVLRIPKHKIFENANDQNHDARDLITQELEIYKLLQDSPIPVPRPYGYYEIDGYPAMVCEYVDDDGSALPDVELGRIAALIHSTALPVDWKVKLVAMESDDVITTLINRMVRRLESFVKCEPSASSWVPEREALEKAAESLRRLPNRLLHMDLRQVNVRIKTNSVIAVFDWTNALIGPAVVDIYRILELGKPGEGFLQAYKTIAPVAEITKLEETVLRLDAALMLSLVYLSEAPDPVNRVWSVKRVEELVTSLEALNSSP